MSSYQPSSPASSDSESNFSDSDHEQHDTMFEMDDMVIKTPLSLFLESLEKQLEQYHKDNNTSPMHDKWLIHFMQKNKELMEGIDDVQLATFILNAAQCVPHVQLYNE